MKSISVSLLEAALEEKEQYLEELKRTNKALQKQIANLEFEVDGLLIRIYESYKKTE